MSSCNTPPTSPPPTVSVIIPTYNRSTSLLHAVRSVITQSHPPDEIIVVDDGSTDDTADLLHSHFPTVHYHYQKNRGVSAARNAGISAARNTWLAFLDSDDVWHPTKLERQLAAVANSADKVCHTNELWIRNGHNLKQQKKHKKFGGDIFRHCLPLCCISPSSVIIHRDVFEAIGTFDEQLPACEDYDLWLRICARYSVHYIDEPLLTKYGGHDDQLSRRYWGMDRFRIRSLAAIIDHGELCTNDRNAAITEIIRKIDIYLIGLRKRARQDEEVTYTSMRERYMRQLPISQYE